MHSLTVGHAHCFTYFVNIQVTSTGGWVGTKTDGFIGKGDMRRSSIGAGVDGYGLYAMFTCRFDDADGNFAAIGDENFAEGRWQ